MPVLQKVYFQKVGQFENVTLYNEPQIINLFFVLSFPNRYSHSEIHFNETRGIHSLNQAIANIGLKTVIVLDYAWLQKNYYSEKNTYGFNWLPQLKQQAWHNGKIFTLLQVLNTSS